VKNSVKQACSHVVAVEWLLWEAMAMVGRDVLHPIWVSLKNKESLPESLWVPLYPFAFVSPGLGQ
jgi:hypothetical protein